MYVYHKGFGDNYYYLGGLRHPQRQNRFLPDAESLAKDEALPPLRPFVFEAPLRLGQLVPECSEVDPGVVVQLEQVLGCRLE